MLWRISLVFNVIKSTNNQATCRFKWEEARAPPHDQTLLLLLLLCLDVVITTIDRSMLYDRELVHEVGTTAAQPAVN